jgi:hypothetical protein
MPTPGRLGERARGAGRQQRLPRIIVTMRGLLLFLVCLCARADSMDDAVAALAKKVTARLSPAETARVTSRNVSSLPAADATKVQTALNRALQRRVRNPMPVDVALTISENLRGYLLVAEIKRESETMVEMAEFRADAPTPPARAAITIERKLLWEQDAPILDVAVNGDSMLVLDTTQITRYQRNAGKWESAANGAFQSNARDPRGRIVCEQLSGSCMDNAPSAATAQIGTDTLVADVDSRIHLYDSAHTPVAAFEDWGSDFAALTACGGTHIAATAAGDLQSKDFVTLYDIVNRAPVRVSEPLEFPGPVTALWPSADGALAVARNLSTGRYAAYLLTLDCGR